ncbi:MAG: isochorismatase family cysteine hydrolase [Methyloceanibacter sp.]|uniref:cysteine hydrolase family protein n=2 Tax=Methyloceanibacter sp. TaxID=1965321 RepID=UPI003C414E8E
MIGDRYFILSSALAQQNFDAMAPTNPLTSINPLTRDRPITAGKAALLVVDMQNGTCGPEEAARRPEFHSALTSRVIPNIAQLLRTFRSARLEVIYTVIENLTADGRDRSLDYKLSSMGFPMGSPEAQVTPALAPQKDELVLPKSSSSVFNSTTLDYLLRNIGIQDVFVAGCLTDQCIDHAVKDGADRGFYMTCVHDACAAETEARHQAALACFNGYCRMLRTADVVGLITAG